MTEGVGNQPESHKASARPATHSPLDVDLLSRVRPAAHRFPIVQCPYQDVRVRMVGIGVFTRPLTETFPEFLAYFALHLLGREWHDAQRSKPDARRHVVMQWWFAWQDWLKSHPRGAEEIGPVRRVPTTGPILALLTLGYDLYCLAHMRSLPDEMLTRLRDRSQFQGARYEAMVAAIFVRARYSLVHTHGSTEKRCEFEAVWPPTQERIAVEAKSRHRPGHYNEPGLADTTAALRGDIESLLRAGLKQRTEGIPFVLFVELNSPLSPTAEFPDRRWYRDLLSLLQRRGPASPVRQDDMNALFITNHSPHLIPGQLATPPGEMVAIFSPWPRHPLSMQSLAALYSEHLAYGYIPEDTEQGY
ncbi:MAG: hypothetical protein NTX53_04600 [candidate division WOR-3 bacterium]|nr:hypothetical protein [candidate division WOR-3 bacterium]